MSHTIVYLSDFDLLAAKANCINVMQMCRAFHTCGCRVVLIAPGNNGDDITRHNLDNIYSMKVDWEILSMTFPKKLYTGRAFLYAMASLNTIRSFTEACLFYTRNPWLYFAISVFLKLPVIYEAHQYRYKQNLHTTIYHFLIRVSSKHTGSRGIVAISRKLRDCFLRSGINKEDTIVAHDGVNIADYQPEISKVAARRKLNLSVGKRLVVYTGSLIPGKGFEQLMQVAPSLHNCVVLIVGGEPHQIEKLKRKYIGTDVQFTGKVFPGIVPVYQFAADVLCLPNNFGSPIDDVTSPMKLFEYMASGRPIVAGDMPSIREVLSHNHNAVLYKPGQIAELRDSINALLLDNEMAKRLSLEAQNTAKNYTWKKRAESIVSYIDKRGKSKEVI